MENEILKKLDNTIVEREKLKLRLEKIADKFSDLEDWMDENMCDLIDKQNIDEAGTETFERFYDELEKAIKYS